MKETLIEFYLDFYNNFLTVVKDGELNYGLSKSVYSEKEAMDYIKTLQ